MRRLSKTYWLVVVLVVLGGLASWQYAGFKAVFAIASLSDPTKLADLRERGANPRLNKILYWLDESRRHWLAPGATITLAQIQNGTHSPRAGLVKAELLRNLKIGDELGLFTLSNREHLRHGRAAIIQRGPYRGEAAEIDHIVPVSLAPELGNELANLELLPERLNRQKSNHVGERQLAQAERFFAAGLLGQESYERVKAQAVVGTNRNTAGVK